ncbi:hypothetical protein Kpol_1045p49 [Vanderwaltozyma polyspora DSM 70294]|uniref:Dipeptidyl peptidase 3 n=1 Tax=Vanderwaltozyma polyspora (strain ATCC 22028 / DSM 70294 / BCRC 21397 / CBS 2163 / NBRC 10782 / NRRL Y-8283 / UCD 57-17) TaxID=436907 RepID=A7TI55_VANPO|nr:uncharacterized protein Kpol_1045p49 [Vanderwaltozyma polyspora DSM 70294]EDO18062.1 hypothetical protein Kpol_1045p49 [Vanderwaltozyma polyspora DSM 70294]
MSKFVADSEPPISILLSSKDSYFKDLTDVEQKYAHYLSVASHFGTRITLRQVSLESELIFDLILYIHKSLNGDYPNEPEKDVKNYLDYVSQFLSNLGNYKSFGDTKFIPGFPKSFLTDVLLPKVNLSIDDDKIWSSFTNFYNEYHKVYFKTLNDLIDIGMFGLNGDLSQLGYPDKGFTSSYYLIKDDKFKISQEDMALLKSNVFTKLNILPENTRIEKTSDVDFTIWVASSIVENTVSDEYPTNQITFSADGKTYGVQFKFGDHSREMEKIAEHLKLAKNYSANETQSKMLDQYIYYFTTGSSNAHKESQKLWVKDLSPIVETNIGFIETYREPSGIIGEWEALVAVQNKDRTAKFSKMVDNAKNFIKLLPWGQDFEKNVFNPPDFTSIEVLTFTGSGIPAGINIPNYDDVRINVGFKNVSLGNILSAATKSTDKYPPTFISEQDMPIYKKCQNESFEVQVGIHELLGHGTGKLLSEIESGKYNFDFENPPLGLEGNPIRTYYKLGETWSSKFGSISGAFEECRAELVAMYLITNRELLEIFGYKTKEEQDNIIYIGYLQMARAGFMALEFWSPETGKWGQPHMQARFSIMKTFLMHSNNENFLKIITDNDANPTDFHLDLDISLIESTGVECVGDFLKHLHVYKSTADVENGTKYFTDRSTVPPSLAKFRDIVIKKRLPRRQFIQANTEVINDKVTVKDYEETPIGMIKSFIERNV